MQWTPLTQTKRIVISDNRRNETHQLTCQNDIDRPVDQFVERTKSALLFFFDFLPMCFLVGYCSDDFCIIMLSRTRLYRVSWMKSSGIILLHYQIRELCNVTMMVKWMNYDLTRMSRSIKTTIDTASTRMHCILRFFR